MPDDSSGIYSVPAGTIVTTGDTILPSQHNPWANDSASAISARFSKDGRAPATGNWNINNFRLTNVGAPVAGGDAVNKTYADAISTSIATKLDILQPSVDVASATMTDIGAAVTQNVRITGSVTITSLGTAPAGTFRRVLFAGVLTLTHNVISLILPGAANITTVAGDIAEFISEGSGNWRCLRYQYSSFRANGGVVESGSNANGGYVRYADGTQICWFVAAAAVTSWTFPAAFSAAPTVSGTAAATGLRSVGLGTVTTTSAVLNTYSAAGLANDVPRHLTAIGRWF